MRYTEYREAGFSIVEILVALTILAVGMLAIAKYQTTLLIDNAESKQRATAIFLSEEIMDTFKANDYRDVILSEIAPYPTENIEKNGVVFTRTVDVTQTPGMGGKKITVTVAYPDRKGNPITKKFETMVADFNPANNGLALVTLATTTTTAATTTTTAAAASSTAASASATTASSSSVSSSTTTSTASTTTTTLIACACSGTTYTGGGMGGGMMGGGGGGTTLCDTCCTFNTGGGMMGGMGGTTTLNCSYNGSSMMKM